MARIPTVNPYRTYDNKEIDIVSLLPNNMKGGEIETFTELFQTYLNEMYEGTTKYIPPEQLEAIPYTDEIIWTNNYEYITAPYSNFLTTFQAGDFVKKNNDTVWYKVEEVIDNSTIKLTEPFINVSPSYLKSAYWENFSTVDWTSFWVSVADGGTGPIGMDSSFKYNYKIDYKNSRVYYDDDGPTYVADTSASIIATDLLGENEFELGFQRSTKSEFRNNLFGFQFESGTITYKIYYENGFLNLSVDNNGSVTTSGYIELNEDEDNWVVNVTRKRDTNKIKVKVSSLRPKSGSVPYTFTSGVGYFNRFEHEFNMPSEDVFANKVTLKILNGWMQGWDYFYFQSDSGFPGEVDNITLVNSLKEMPESTKVFGTLFGRTFETDGEYPSSRFPIYQFYQLNGLLRIRNLEESITISGSDFRKGMNHISILEKIRRLTELHDPDLIDMEYIQYFARYMGYTVDVNKDTLSSFYNQDSFTNEEKQDVMDKYLRSIMGNLPHWYKIKSTGNAIAIMLYSFGLVTDIRNFYCTDYGDRSTWLSFGESETETPGLTDKHFITPHFGIRFDIEGGIADEEKLAASMTAIIDAVNSVRPINTVFEGLEAYFKRNMNSIYISSYAYSNQYVYLK